MLEHIQPNTDAHTCHKLFLAPLLPKFLTNLSIGRSTTGKPPVKKTFSARSAKRHPGERPYLVGNSCRDHKASPRGRTRDLAATSGIIKKFINYLNIRCSYQQTALLSNSFSLMHRIFSTKFFTDAMHKYYIALVMNHSTYKQIKSYPMGLPDYIVLT